MRNAALHELTKRVFDLTCVIAMSPVAVPLTGILALAVRLTSPGPAIFMHPRVGRNRRPIRVYKLRTMTVDSPRGPELTAGGDARVTALGHFLRRFKLDEVPQLLNVLRGEMSLVGPRPESPHFVSDDVAWHEILSVKPGLTDLASVTFRHEEELLATSQDPVRAYEELVLPVKLALAREGLRRQSLRYDLWIMFKTLRVLSPFPNEEPATIAALRNTLRSCA